MGTRKLEVQDSEANRLEEKEGWLQRKVTAAEEIELLLEGDGREKRGEQRAPHSMVTPQKFK
jgi:hypothetical protein